jgi:hypothetical protein
MRPPVKFPAIGKFKVTRSARIFGFNNAEKAFQRRTELFVKRPTEKAARASVWNSTGDHGKGNATGLDWWHECGGSVRVTSPIELRVLAKERILHIINPARSTRYSFCFPPNRSDMLHSATLRCFLMSYSYYE